MFRFQMPIIKLKTSEGEIFETDVQIAKCSATIKTMLEECGMDEEIEGDGAVLPLSEVNADTLRLILKWALHHKDDPVVEKKVDEIKEKQSDDISEWDSDLLKIEQSKQNANTFTVFYAFSNIISGEFTNSFFSISPYFIVGALFHLIAAANYLDIKGLFAVACKTVANMMKGKSPEEIRKIFDIEDELTEEEREIIRKEDEWCREK